VCTLFHSLQASSFGEREAASSALKAAMARVWGTSTGVRYVDLLLDLCRSLVPPRGSMDGDDNVVSAPLCYA